ncbi:autotransporter assembly complex protein TamA [Motilimonas cestriensis]|uniref:Translocation and assembly module subunit TamA n=1 Tax=Motilimonas cestriensis TaxID=2742685 RepID=A0ABS8WCF7_9GAMM|nr:autotransporter assembly complex family protein [Motilimonas cestriensis]MCE2595446.1 autotransporter assembly complex protein TamA [Motilimonas cestriensis]
MVLILRFAMFTMALLISVSAMAKVDLTIEGLDGELEANVEAYLLSVAEPTGKNLGSYRDSLETEAANALKALGYYHSDVKLDVSLKDGQVGKLKVVANISAGEPVIIKALDLKLIGEARHDEVFLTFAKKLPLQVDKPLNHGVYASAKSSITSMALQRGYFNGKFVKSKVEVEAKENKATIVLWFDSGIRFRYGPLVFTQPSPAEALVRNMANFEQGDYYLTTQVAQYSLQVSDSGYFRNVLVRPNIEKAIGNQVPIEVTVGLKPTNSFEVGAGVTTDNGPRVKFGWSRPWVNDWGHSLGADLELSKQSQTISTYYKIPIDNPNWSYLNVQTGYQRLDENDTESTKFTLGVQRFWKTPGNWDRTAFIKYDIEDSIQGNQELKTKLIIPGISYSRTRVRGGLNAVWGDKQLISTEVSSKYWASDEDIFKVYGQTKWLRSLTEKHRVLARLELGAIAVDSINSVPSSMRFFAGGDQSIRGYDYKSIAPRSDDNKLIGGKYLTVASLEYSYPVKPNWRIATFIDGGTATNDFSEDLQYGTGAGVAWASPIGPIKLFLGVPLNSEETAVRLHFLMGPEL